MQQRHVRRRRAALERRLSCAQEAPHLGEGVHVPVHQASTAQGLIVNPERAAIGAHQCSLHLQFRRRAGRPLRRRHRACGGESPTHQVPRQAAPIKHLRLQRHSLSGEGPCIVAAQVIDGCVDLVGHTRAVGPVCTHRKARLTRVQRIYILSQVIGVQPPVEGQIFLPILVTGLKRNVGFRETGFRETRFLRCTQR